MRRISAKNAKVGMVLGRPIYDSQGFEVVELGTEIDEKLQRTLSIHGVAELFIKDWRVEDVPVQPMISPELEGLASRALKTIIEESQGSTIIDEVLLEEAEDPIFQIAREFYPEVIGEVNVSGCSVLEDYSFVQPVKAAGVAMLIGRRLGLGMLDLAGLGLACMFKDLGAIALPAGVMDKPDPSEADMKEIKRHPVHSAEIISQLGRFGSEISEYVYYHHERWDGSGYPEGLKGKDIPIGARIIAVADSYYEIVSKRPKGTEISDLMPHEAIEYIMAYSGELFDPEIVGIFSRQVPLFPTGVTVRLNTGEMGIISNSNLGHIGRPTVRICVDEENHQLKEPFDLDLAMPENQGRLIVQVVDY